MRMLRFNFSEAINPSVPMVDITKKLLSKINALSSMPKIDFKAFP